MSQDWRQGLESRLRSVEGAGLETLPPLQRALVALSAAQVGSLFTSPAEIVAAVPGKIIVPQALRIHRAAGFDAWTVSFGNLRLQLYAFAFFFTIGNTEIPNILGSEEGYWLQWDPIAEPTFIAELQGVGRLTAMGYLGGPPFGTNLPLLLDSGNEDPTGGTGGIEVAVWYRAWPIEGA